MNFGTVWRRGLTALAATGLAAGLVTTLGSSAATAATCPTVSSTGAVTPAPTPGIDWSGCDLRGTNLAAADLSGANLSNAILARANLDGANLSGANLDGTSFYFARLTGAALTDATMSSSTSLEYVTSGQLAGSPIFPAGSPWQVQHGYLIGPYASLVQASLADADLAGADLFGAFLGSANLAGANLSGADLEASLWGANLSGANLTGADLRSAGLTNATLTGATLTGAVMNSNTLLGGVISGGVVGQPASLPNNSWLLAGGYLVGPDANLAEADLAGLDLTAATLNGANLADANMASADLFEAQLSGSDLSGTRLAGANLDGVESGQISGTPASLPSPWTLLNGYLLGPKAGLQEASLAGFDLAGLDLAGANFYYANLTGANLDGTDLADSHLWFTNLTTATVTGANFTGASWYSTTCPNGTDSNIYQDGCFSPLDTTPPLLHLNVRNGQVFAIGMAPKVQCTATDKYSVVTVDPTLKITGSSSHGLGKFTATCSGAVDLAGLTAKPISATYWIAYGFDGMIPQQGSTVPTYPRTLKVHFFLSGRTKPISATTAWAMVHKHDVKVTLRGPGIKATTALCGSYSSTLGFVCKLTLPHVRTGRSYSYTLTAYENNGFGFVRAPGEPTAENPVTIHFK